MEKKAAVTIARRLRGGMDFKSYGERIEREFPDAVLRLAQDKAKESGKSQQPNLENAYGAMNLIQPPFSMAIMARLSSLDPYLEGAIEAVAANVAACETEIAWTGDGEGNKKQRKELEEFFFESNDPANPMSLQEKISICAVDYITLGSWNLEIVEGGKRLVDLVHAPSEYVRVRASLSGYVMIKDGQEVPFSLYGDANREDGINQILRAIRKRPGHRVYGKPNIHCLANTVLMNSLRDEKNLKWFDQGLLADLLVLLEDSLDDGVKKQVETAYQNTSDGEQNMFILHGVGKGIAKELKRTMEDKGTADMETNNRQRVLSALRTPPAKVAIYEDANRANSLTQDETFRAEVIKPIQDTFRVRFNHVIKYGFGYDGWEFRMKPYALKDRKEEAEIIDKYVDDGVYTVNEARAELNKPPVKGGDRRVVNTPLGLVDIDSWTIAVADPSLASTGSATGQAARLVTRLIELRREIAGLNHDSHD